MMVEANASSVMRRLRRRTWEIIGPTRPGDTVSRLFDIGMNLLIAANVVAVIVSTVGDVYDRHADLLDPFEAFSVLVFAIEYLLSAWSCIEDPRYPEPWRGRWRYLRSPLALFDLLAILPFFIVWLPIDLRFMRALRLLRLLRLFKGARYSAALQTLGRVVRAEQHNLVGALVVIAVVVVMAGCLMYFAERDAQPDLFSSIPEAMWWAVAVLVKLRVTTIEPVTGLGKGLAAFLAFWGVIVIALPAAILSSGFMADLRRRRAGDRTTCPHCGGKLE